MITGLKMWPLERTRGKKLKMDDTRRTKHYHKCSLWACELKNAHKVGEESDTCNTKVPTVAMFTCKSDHYANSTCEGRSHLTG